jgi:hypothetical protein
MTRLVPLLALALLAPMAQAGTHSITTTVTDRNGSGLGRTIVSLGPSPDDVDAKPYTVELVTDRQGNVLIDYLRDTEGERTKLSKKTQYVIEVFKPGFHTYTTSFYYKKGEVVLDPVVLVEETIEVEDIVENLDPATTPDSTHAAGANYEGQ